jgi:hypothetical protein
LLDFFLVPPTAFLAIFLAAGFFSAGFFSALGGPMLNVLREGGARGGRSAWLCAIFVDANNQAIHEYGSTLSVRINWPDRFVLF